MTSVSVPTTSKDFHGDGMDAEVDVVYADSLLWHVYHAPVLQPALEDHFIPGYAKPPALSRLGTFDLFLTAMHSPTSCLVCGTNIPAAFFSGALGHHQPIGFGNRATINSRGFQPSPDGRSGHAKRTS